MWSGRFGMVSRVKLTSTTDISLLADQLQDSWEGTLKHISQDWNPRFYPDTKGKRSTGQAVI